jgi:hypothetical protein
MESDFIGAITPFPRPCLCATQAIGRAGQRSKQVLPVLMGLHGNGFYQFRTKKSASARHLLPIFSGNAG